MWENKFIPSEHEVLIDSSFTDYSDEKIKFFVKSYILRLVGAVRSRWYYRTAESKIRKNYPDVARSQDIARQDGGLIGQYQWVRLLEIATLTKYFNIKSVCEFGSGGSTAMFSQLNLEKFVSLEQNKKWAERTKQCLPDGAKVELLRKDRLVIDFDGEPCTHYDLPDEFYEQVFDMIYIDGPTAMPLSSEESALPILDKSKQMMPNIDIELFFSKNIYPRIILVDGRRPTVRRLCQNYSHKYDIFLRYNYKSHQDSGGGFLYHSVFIKK